eukprot:TRINITY_DN106965_c0_g1_i1.p1 TRINITY_DN106965_c0_g1~~TRINITY_DN106965_c0_g1_i1.p1  ORF type:complete len:725 (-),score=105.99 TRINITY_DN106965_c0_g1_i1:228-2159(-)
MLSSRVQSLLATFDDNNTVPEDVREALAVIRELVQDLRSKLQEPIASEQSSLQALADAFQACADVALNAWPAMQEGEPPLQAEKADAQNNADAHHDCRSAEVQHRSEVVGQTGACSVFQTAIEEAHSNKPALSFANLDDFFTNNFDAAIFMQKATACETGVKTYQTQTASCKDSQETFEMATCHWHLMAIQADFACASLQLCRDREGSALSDACTKANATVERMNAEAVALDQIECLLGELDAGNIKAAAVQACTVVGNASSVNLTCPDVLASSHEQQCKSLVKPADLEAVPGTAQWIETQYRGKSWFSDATNNPGTGEEISSVVACELPRVGSTPATTPAPENLKLWTANWRDVRYYDLNGSNPLQYSVTDELWEVYQKNGCGYPALSAGLGAVYISVWCPGRHYIAKKPFDGSSLEILVEDTGEVHDVLFGESKLYWHTDSRRLSADDKPAVLWRANLDGSEVEPLVYDDEFELVRQSTDEYRTNRHGGVTLSEDGKSLYFARQSHSKNAVYLYRKPLDGAGLSFVKQISPKVINGQDVEVILDKSDIYIGYRINWDRKEAGFARCSYAAPDAWPCPAVFEGGVGGDAGHFVAITDHRNNKLIWRLGAARMISDLDGTNADTFASLEGLQFSIGPGPSAPL